jgi:hypothetical protein
MTVLHHSGDSPVLLGSEGELISIRVSVEPKLLEDLLETLSSLDFPINPQLYHHTGLTTVEFPAYSAQLRKIREILGRHGFDTRGVTHAPILARGQTAS